MAKCLVAAGYKRANFYAQAGVNMVRWDGTGTMLASCSDDGTAKVVSLAVLCY
jgi:hypothetical protein